jgi:hypothetical protein
MAITRTAAKPAAKAVPRPAAKPVARAAASDEQLVPMVEFSSGLVDDIDGTVSEVAAMEWDMNGKSNLAPFLAVEIIDPNGAAHVEYYSLGKLEDWKPAASGLGFVAVSGKSRISDSSNLGNLLKSLFEAGFPKDDPALASGNLAEALTGLKAHFLRKKIERKGLIRTGAQAERESAGTLLVSRIIQLPGGEETATATAGTSKAAAGGKPNGVAKASASAAPAADTEITKASVEAGDQDADIANVLLEAVGEGEVLKRDISKLVNSHFKEAGMATAVCNAMVVRATKQDFLTALADFGIEYTGSSIKQQEA